MSLQTQTMLTDLLVDVVTDRSAPLSDEWAKIGEQAFVDTVAVTLAGSSEDHVRMLEAALEGTAGSTYSLALSRPLSTRDAALLDGTSAHALDLDDMDEAYIAHPSAVLFPALWSIGQSIDASGEDVLAAFRVGLMTNRLIAAHLDITSHYRAGWHPTSTIGTVGAAAAAARLLGADADAVRRTIGIAGSLAAGSRQNFGTMVKPLHAGFAASNGVLAAQLGQQGFTSSPEQLTGPIGFLELFRGSSVLPMPAEEAIEQALSATALNIKRYACCYRTHPAIEAATELAAQIGPDDVAKITVTVQPAGLIPLIHHRPVDGAEAKFSIEFTVASALLDGFISLSSFDEVSVHRPQVQSLLRLVTAHEAETPPVGPSQWNESFAVVSVTTSGGRTLNARVDAARGHADAPLTEEQLRTKFSQCLRLEGQGVPDAIYEPLRKLRAQPSMRETVHLIRQLRPIEGETNW